MSRFQLGGGGGRNQIQQAAVKTSRTDGTGNMSSRKSRRAKAVARKARRARGRAGLTIQLDSERPVPRF